MLKIGDRVKLSELGRGYFTEYPPGRMGIVTGHERAGDALRVHWDNQPPDTTHMYTPDFLELYENPPEPSVVSFQEQCDKLAQELIEKAYSGSSRLVGITALVGALAACAKEGGVPLENVIKSLTGVWEVLE